MPFPILLIIPLVMFAIAVLAPNGTAQEQTNNGVLNIYLITIPPVHANQPTTLDIKFADNSNHSATAIYQVTIYDGVKQIFKSLKSPANGTAIVPFTFPRASDYIVTVDVFAENGHPLGDEYAQFDVIVPLPTPEFGLQSAIILAIFISVIVLVTRKTNLRLK